MPTQKFPADPVARRFIGRTVHELREAKNWTLEETAIQAEFTKSTLQRVEKADPHVRFKPRDFTALLECLGADSELSSVLMTLAATLQSGQRSDASTEWWKPYLGDAIPKWFELYLRLESEADEVKIYEAELITGLLQTQAYARAIIMDSLPGQMSEEEGARRLEARMQRGTLLARENPPRLKVILNQAVIYRTIGMGPQVAKEQLEALLKASTRPYVDLRILAFEAGVHGGMSGAAGFTELTFPLLPGTDKPVEVPLVYSDFPTGSQYQSEPDDVIVYDRIWAALVSKALDPVASREAIQTALGGLT